MFCSRIHSHNKKKNHYALFLLFYLITLEIVAQAASLPLCLLKNKRKPSGFLHSAGSLILVFLSGHLRVSVSPCITEICFIAKHCIMPETQTVKVC